MKSSLFHGKQYNLYLKRVMDLVLASILLLIFSPVCLLVSIAIKLDSEGPIFADVPERVGQNGALFKMFKFRSMIKNAHVLLHTDSRFKALFEQYQKDSYKLKDDPRVTPVGRWIRKHSLDEIPQLLNVLLGEMSIVGPRAYYPDELENQQKKHPDTKKFVADVLSVKPGITGLWQVSGRSEVHFDKRIALDAEYIKSISLLEDIRIIFKTPLVMITGRGAV
jgi:lipopolysaccharide/colanic/teichoic acid biosynthesis glycosyltransferase